MTGRGLEIIAVTTVTRELQGPAVPFGGHDAVVAGSLAEAVIKTCYWLLVTSSSGGNTKRTICRFWEQARALAGCLDRWLGLAEGTCTRGDCTWAHGEEELGA